jgi:hypothetical protein
LFAVACSSPSKTVEHRATPPATRTRVILYGTEDFTGDAKRLRLIPVACAIDGVYKTGLPCGEALPDAIDARIVGGALVHAERSRADFHDKAGDQHYKAPRGPECCSYNTCRGDTIPYVTAPRGEPPEAPRDEHGLPDHGAHHVVAVWPADADTGLVAHAPKAGADLPAPPKFTLDQLVRVGSVALAAGRPASDRYCASCARLLHQHDGAEWQAVDRGERGPSMADGYVVMITTDLDRDGRPEAIVRERWRNGHGAMVLGNDWSKSAHRFACGSI